jgi:hypothetical protein
MYLFGIIGAALMIIAVVWYDITEPNNSDDGED